MENFAENRYYKLNKFYMTSAGIWPGQSLFMRFSIPFLLTIALVSIIIPELIRMRDISDDVDNVIECLPPLLTMAAVLIKFYNGAINIDKLRDVVERIASDWEYFKDAPSLEILHEYAGRGRYITLAYTIYIYSAMSLYLILPVMPVILDFLIPLNDTRSKKPLFEAEYGVELDDYFYPILIHGYVTTVITISILVSIDSMLFVNVEHACALFKIVGINLQQSFGIKESDADRDFKMIRYCVNLHRRALSFADLLESYYYIAFGGIIFIYMLAISLTGLLAVIKMDDTDDFLRSASLAVSMAFSLFLNSVPGQRLIDHSSEVHTMAYEFDWNLMPAKIQKLVLPMMLRSFRPCKLTGGKIYIISMESFSWVMQTAMSYFTVFSSMR